MANQVANQQLKRRSINLPLQMWLILIGLFVLLVALQSFAVYTVFTSKFAGGNDFFVRWLGGREYLLNGTNPFDQSVAEKAQKAMFGRLAQAGDKDEAYFAYPLYTLYFFWPLSLLPYAWAQAIWITLLQFMLLVITILSMWLAGWYPPKWLFVVTVLWGIFFYNGARAILLGQFSVLVGLALLLALWAVQNRRDNWAGVFLAVTTIKPQMVFLVLLFLFLWLLVQRRWRVVISFGVSMLVLVMSSMLLVPTWPLDFVNNIIAYSDYVAFGTPLENLLHYFLPTSAAAPLTILLSVLFFLSLLPGWWFALRSSASDSHSGQVANGGAFTWAIMTTLIVGSLITFRSATTNQVILYLPLFFFFRRLTLFPPMKPCSGGFIPGVWRGEGGGGTPPTPPAPSATPFKMTDRRVNFVIVLIEIGLWLFMWGIFAITLEGNWEHIMMHGLLPALMLLLYAIDWRALWRTAGAVEQRSQFYPGQVS